MTKPIKVYVAGKVSKDSSFGTHHWRDDFLQKLEDLSGLTLENLDPTKLEVDQTDPEAVFGADAALIKVCDLLIVYLSDDISVGGSQEILIAKYFSKPVIGLAPLGGKFNGSSKQLFGKTVRDYKDPFVFSTCDIVVSDIDELARSLENLPKTPKSIALIDELAARFDSTN